MSSITLSGTNSKTNGEYIIKCTTTLTSSYGYVTVIEAGGSHTMSYIQSGAFESTWGIETFFNQNGYVPIMFTLRESEYNNRYIGAIIYISDIETEDTMYIINMQTGVTTKVLNNASYNVTIELTKPILSLGGLSALNLTSTRNITATYNNNNYNLTTTPVSIPISSDVNIMSLNVPTQTLTVNNGNNLTKVKYGSTEYTSFPANITLGKEFTSSITASGKNDPVITINYNNTNDPVITNS